MWLIGWDRWEGNGMVARHILVTVVIRFIIYRYVNCNLFTVASRCIMVADIVGRDDGCAPFERERRNNSSQQVHSIPTRRDVTWESSPQALS